MNVTICCINSKYVTFLLGSVVFGSGDGAVRFLQNTADGRHDQSAGRTNCGKSVGANAGCGGFFCRAYLEYSETVRQAVTEIKQNRPGCNDLCWAGGFLLRRADFA